MLGIITTLIPQEYAPPDPFPVRVLTRRGGQVVILPTQAASAAQNCKHTVTFSSADYKGHIRLLTETEASESLKTSQSAATWQNRLEKLRDIGAGNITVTKPDGVSFVLEFTGTLANKFVRALTLKNETFKTSYLSGYWATKETAYVSWPVGSTWLATGQLTPSHKTYSLLPVGEGPASGTYIIYVLNTSNQQIAQVDVPYNSTAAQLQSQLNAVTAIGTSGVTVLGDSLTAGSMQIDMANAKYVVTLTAGTSTVELLPSGRTVQFNDRNELTGVSWNY